MRIRRIAALAALIGALAVTPAVFAAAQLTHSGAGTVNEAYGRRFLP